MVKTAEEILSALKEVLKEDTSDEALAILEDVSDTFNDFEDKIKNDGVDWKQKYEDNDKEWRNKYRDRFFNHSSDDPEIETIDETDEEKTKFDELFTEEGVK